MEKFKELNDITKIDKKHELLSQVTGYKPNLELTHKALNDITLNCEVPEEIKNQFNVARNMALYCYFLYALAPEVQLKTYTIIEFALRIKAEREGIKGKDGRHIMLKRLLSYSVNLNWICDKGFRHIEEPSLENEWCKGLVSTMSSLRNSQAHGSNLLVPDFYHHICVCADFLNQLFPKSSNI